MALFIALSGNKHKVIQRDTLEKKEPLVSKTAIAMQSRSLLMSITQVKTSDKPQGLLTCRGECEKRESFKGESGLLVIRP